MTLRKQSQDNIPKERQKDHQIKIKSPEEILRELLAMELTSSEDEEDLEELLGLEFSSTSEEPTENNISG